jgi:methyl-accepting chemotaxis protein
MLFKDVWAKTGNWLRDHKLAPAGNYQPEVNHEGLLTPQPEPGETVPEAPPEETPKDKVVVKTLGPAKKQESLEKLQEGFNSLIDQLQGINEHLNQQVAQHEQLMGRIEELPRLLGSFPELVENQRQSAQHLIDQLKAATARDERFVDVVEKIPTETAKQTDALVNIDHQLAAAADSDVQMTESFNKFNETLARLNQTTGGQTDSIMQMSKTFATSDRYLKYLISRQNRRFMWIFMIAMGVCLVAILALVGIVIYLNQ